MQGLTILTLLGRGQLNRCGLSSIPVGRGEERGRGGPLPSRQPHSGGGHACIR